MSSPTFPETRVFFFCPYKSSIMLIILITTFSETQSYKHNGRTGHHSQDEFWWVFYTLHKHFEVYVKVQYVLLF